MGVRGKQSFPRLAEEEGSRSPPTSFFDLSKKWSEAIAGATNGSDCPRAQLAKEQQPAVLAVVGSQASPIHTVYPGPAGPGTPSCIRTGSGFTRAPVLGAFGSQDTNAADTYIGKGPAGFYARGADPCVRK